MTNPHPDEGYATAGGDPTRASTDGGAPESELDALVADLHAEAERDRPPEATPDIGIIMGSDSDLAVMAGSESGRPGAYDALTTLGFEEQTDNDSPPESRFTFETYVVSAHRTPELMYAYAETAEDRGLDVVIAGAGGKSADLPNMTASIAYPLPVIGVPVQEKSVPSVIGMPQGAPLVAVDAGKSFNAALSAAQLLARQHDQLRERLLEYHEDLVEDVAVTSRQLHDLGTEGFRRHRGD
jgi:5-(carboxyamino)imidazole ribonucleotide mutase